MALRTTNWLPLELSVLERTKTLDKNEKTAEDPRERQYKIPYLQNLKRKMKTSCLSGLTSFLQQANNLKKKKS